MKQDEGESTNLRVCKDFHKLLKNVDSLSSGQAKVTEWKEEDLQWFDLEIIPRGGLYHGGKFMFRVYTHSYPLEPPTVVCRTRIYHPNIDTEMDDLDFQEDLDDLYTNVCVNLLGEEWDQNFTFEDCVQSILFLFYEPNIDDPLSPLIDSSLDYKRYIVNVKQSLLGMTVEGYFTFERNYFLEDFDEALKEMNDLEEKLASQTEEVSDNNNGSSEVKNAIDIMCNNPEGLVGRQTCVDLICDIESKPTISMVTLLPDLVNVPNPFIPSEKDPQADCDTKPADDKSIDHGCYTNVVVPCCDSLNLANVPDDMSIDRCDIGANSVVIDCGDSGVQLTTSKSGLQKCISVTVWAVRLFLTKIIPELYRT